MRRPTNTDQATIFSRRERRVPKTLKTPRQKRCNNPKITDIQLANLKKRRPGWDGWEILLEVRGKQSLAIPMTAHGDLLPREGDTESFTNTKNKTNNNESKCEGLLTRTKQQYSHEGNDEFPRL